MPELPEVETVVRTLEHMIKDEEIISVEVLYPNIIEGDVNEFIQRMTHQHFREFKRRGKYLLFEMDDFTFVSHLRMEGKYFVMDHDEAIDKHTHVIFHLKDKDLRYNDVRKFGRMEIIPKASNYDVFKKLGPEPFSDSFNLDYVKEYFKPRASKCLKALLLDQSFVAGIGNIYADEIAFLMGIHPETKVSKLSKNDILNLIKYTKEVLQKGIDCGGTTIRSYTSSLGVTGRFQHELLVHTQKVCKKCNGEIKKIVVATRGTYYCPKCQKRK